MGADGMKGERRRDLGGDETLASVQISDIDQVRILFGSLFI